jgi:hypothetical protein
MCPFSCCLEIEETGGSFTPLLFISFTFSSSLMLLEAVLLLFVPLLLPLLLLRWWLLLVVELVGSIMGAGLAISY